ncbi:MAG: amidase [Thermomicrobiales bacterium]
MAPRPSNRTSSHRRLTRRGLVAGALLTGGMSAGAIGARRLTDRSAMRTASPTATSPSVAVSPTAPAATTKPNDLLALEHATVGQLRRALDARQLSVAELVAWSLARVEAMDGGDRGLGAVIELNPEALEIAATRDRELAREEGRGPLHGVPVLVKDLFATADAMETTAGSLALLDNAVVRDAFVVDRLRAAGAIILGKANLTEWSNFEGSSQTSGWSSRGGQTHNPYRLDRSPWGSSSGSAVAVAAGYVPLALGVETDGSIVAPASATATVGFKPTVGLTSRSGVIPISFTQDSPGPMARTVEDAAYLLTAIAGYDPADPAYGEVGWTAPAALFAEFPVHEPGAVDYTRFLDADGLRGARIGVARDLFYVDDAGALVDEVLPVLEAAGAIIVDPAPMPTVEDLAPGQTEWAVTITEFPYALERYLANYAPNGPMWGIADIVAYNEAHADEALVYFDQAVFYDALEAGSVWDEYYQEMAGNGLALAREQGIDAVMDELELDALIAPTTGAPTAISLGGDDFPGACSQISAIAGYPIINVPVGYVDGLPVGMSFMGRAFSEPTLITLAYAFEQVHPVRRPPEYLAGSAE